MYMYQENGNLNENFKHMFWDIEDAIGLLSYSFVIKNKNTVMNLLDASLLPKQYNISTAKMFDFYLQGLMIRRKG